MLALRDVPSSISPMSIDQNDPQIAQPKLGRKRSVDKHKAILAAAADLVIDVGYDAATMEGVAARADVGKQTLYRWWPSKGALYAEAYTTLVPRAALTSNAQRAEIRLVNLLSHLFDLYAMLPAAQILRGLICEAQRNETARNVLHDDLIERNTSLLQEIFEAGIKAGELGTDFDVDWAASEVMAHIWYRLLTDPALLDPEFAQKLAQRVCCRVN